MFTINQAIGVLIGRGHTPAAAGEQLRQQARELQRDVHRTAAYVLKSASIE